MYFVDVDMNTNLYLMYFFSTCRVLIPVTLQDVIH